MPTIRDVVERLIGLRGELLADISAVKVAEEVFVLLAEKKTSSVPRKELYNQLVLHVGVSKVDAIDALFQFVKSEPDGFISMQDFIEAASKRCRQLLYQQQQQTSQTTEKKAAAAAKQTDGRAPKQQVLRGSERLNKLSQTKAFRLAVVNKGAAQSMYQVFCAMGGSATSGVTFPHLKAYLNKTNPKMAVMAHSLFSTLDKGNKGELSFPEMLSMFYPEASPSDLQDICRMSGFTAEQEGELGVQEVVMDAEALMGEVEQVFKVFDGEGSGRLDREELAHALILTGFSEEEANDMFVQVDVHRTGTVSFEELRTWYLKFAATTENRKHQQTLQGRMSQHLQQQQQQQQQAPKQQRRMSQLEQTEQPQTQQQSQEAKRRPSAGGSSSPSDSSITLRQRSKSMVAAPGQLTSMATDASKQLSAAKGRADTLGGTNRRSLQAQRSLASSAAALALQ